MSRKKLLVIGSTGFVGRRFCQELINHQFHQSYDITFAARNLTKLETIFPATIRPPEVQLIELDNYNQREVDKIIKSTTVVCNFAGPFAKYAPNVIKACAENGVHYLDITGEVNFIREMISKYDEIAKQTNSTLVPFSGFDSVPSDLAVHLIKEKMRRKHQEDIQNVHVIYKAKGGINGGTIASAFESISSIPKDEMSNLHYLCPNERAYFPSLEEKLRKDDQDRYVAPFFMEQINNKVVYRTKFLSGHQGYAKNFVYEESMHTTANFSFITSSILQKSLELSDILMKKSLSAKLLRKLLPKPGEGPSSQLIENGFFKAKVIGKTVSGKLEKIQIYAEGDPGNKATVNLFLLCLECLLQIPNPPAGFQTPVSCFGDKLSENANKYNIHIKD